MNGIRKVMVTGGAGYVGSVLVPALIAKGYDVSVLDLFIYGRDVLAPSRGSGKLDEIVGDIRNPDDVAKALEGADAVIHLACISNDPSFDLDPGLGKSINYDCFRPLVKAAKEGGVQRFIYASSSSVYGIKEEEQVTEDLPLEPLTDYSKFKAMCEAVLAEEVADDFTVCTVRPATVCGYSPRQRLDVIVNILTNHAVNNGKIRVFGGTQYRPNIHIEDMVDLYLHLLEEDSGRINGQIYNAGYENHTLLEIAEMVKRAVDPALEIAVEETDDLRSYRVNSDKIRQQLGFTPKRTIENAVVGLVEAMRDGKLPDSMNNSLYYNIKRMQELDLK